MEYTTDMTEVSGFGGDYEDCCRRMVIAGAKWLQDNPDKDPQFSGYKGIYGIINEDNDDAKELSNILQSAAGDYGISGAQHQAAVSSVLYIKINGWEKYKAEMTHSGGEVGILKDKIKKLTDDKEVFSKTIDRLYIEKAQRTEIIADKLFGWKQYTGSCNDQQLIYAPSKEAAMNMPLGSLLQLVDAEIEIIIKQMGSENGVVTI